jgi:hypothetical protein
MVNVIGWGWNVIESNELAKHKSITENSWEIQINIKGRCENTERRNMTEYRGICKKYQGISRNMPEFRGICRNFTELPAAIADVDFWQHGRHVVLIIRILFHSERWISPIVIVMVSNKQYIAQLICKYVFQIKENICLGFCLHRNSFRFLYMFSHHILLTTFLYIVHCDNALNDAVWFWRKTCLYVYLSMLYPT